MPSAFEIVANRTPVASFTATTGASAITAPEGSVIVPRIDAPVTWAISIAGSAIKKMMNFMSVPSAASGGSRSRLCFQNPSALWGQSLFQNRSCHRLTGEQISKRGLGQPHFCGQFLFRIIQNEVELVIRSFQP